MVGEHPGEPESQPSPSHYLAEVGSKLLGSGNHMLQPPQYLRPQAWASRLSQNSLWKHTFGLVWSRRLPKAGHSCWGFSWWWPCSVTDQLDTGAQQMRSEGQIHLQYTEAEEYGVSLDFLLRLLIAPSLTEYMWHGHQWRNKTNDSWPLCKI